ncbi:MAG: HAMP domain-containing sensor histidine kinase, partial [Ornithinibacter sp.]
MISERPLDPVSSIKVKLGVLVAVSVVVAVLVDQIGDAAGVPLWMSIPVTVAAALAATQWLARGMTSPLRQMTSAVRAMAGGDYGQRVTATSSDEVGVLAEAFNAMSADLASADLQRRELVATVSHELRTPLTAQRALLENLVDGVVQPDDDALGKALHQAERLSELVADLLDLSRIDAGAVPLRLAPVRVEDLLLRAVDETSVDGRPVRVRHTVHPADLTVIADPARMAQLLANLVDNAIRHTPPHGEVRIGACVQDEHSWLIEVSDDGPGIPADRAARVFERFGSGAATGGGTGLGLAIARWVTELHGGTVAVVPTPPGQIGALLRVQLPRTPRPSTPTQETPMPVTPTTSTPTPVAPAHPTHPAGATGQPEGGGPASPTGPPAGLGTLWPEEDRRPRPGVVLAALGVGTLAALTWPYRGIGLATAMVLLLTGALMWVVARNRT